MTQIKGQLSMTIALRTTCQRVKGYPCTYYVASDLRQRELKEECKVTCCYVCDKLKSCGWACNASKKVTYERKVE